MTGRKIDRKDQKQREKSGNVEKNINEYETQRKGLTYAYLETQLDVEKRQRKRII